MLVWMRRHRALRIVSSQSSEQSQHVNPTLFDYSELGVTRNTKHPAVTVHGEVRHAGGGDCGGDRFLSCLIRGERQRPVER
jgi:hypothetical protein